jgi:hypothetical protein
MNRITPLSVIIALLTLCQLQPTSVMLFGTDDLEPLFKEYMTDKNENHKMFLWMCHPDNFKLEKAHSNFPIDYFLVLSDKQIKFLTETTLNDGDNDEIYVKYIESLNLEDIELNILKDEKNFAMMVFLFRTLAILKGNFPEKNLTNLSEVFNKKIVKINEKLKLIKKDCKFEIKFTKPEESYFGVLIEFFNKVKIDEEKIQSQYLAPTKALFYAIDAFQQFYDTSTSITKLEEQKISEGKNLEIESGPGKVKFFGDNFKAKRSIEIKIYELKISIDKDRVKFLKYYLMFLHLSEKSVFKIEENEDSIIKFVAENIQKIFKIDSDEDLEKQLENYKNFEENKFHSLLEKKIRYPDKKKFFYSFICTKEDKDYFLKPKLKNWATTFFSRLSNGEASENIKPISIKNTLMSVISDSFPESSIVNDDNQIQESGSISLRRYYAYSERSKVLIETIKKLSDSFLETLTDGSLDMFFTIISEIMEDYLTFYPILTNDKSQLLFKTLAHSMMTPLLKLSYEEVFKALNFKKIREISFRCIVLFSIRGNVDLNSHTNLFDNIPVFTLVVSLLNYPSIKNSEAFLDIISRKKSLNIDFEILINTILNHPYSNCKNIFEESGFSDKAGIERSIKECENKKGEIISKLGVKIHLEKKRLI